MGKRSYLILAAVVLIALVIVLRFWGNSAKAESNTEAAVPAAFGEGIEGAVDRYVAMTRATQQLIILTSA